MPFALSAALSFILSDPEFQAIAHKVISHVLGGGDPPTADHLAQLDAIVHTRMEERAKLNTLVVAMTTKR